MSSNLTLVIVGHVDHGKSTLIGRLLFDTDSLSEEQANEILEKSNKLEKDVDFAFVVDQLKEEREQRITIDTSYTYFSSTIRDYTIIDAPGHQRFIQNMMSGASYADVGVLMVDANEGVQEQTVRHLQVLSLIGLNSVIVAINKIDQVENAKSVFDELSSKLSTLTNDLDLDVLDVIPISAQLGYNIVEKCSALDWYDGPNLLSLLDNFENVSWEGRFNSLSLPIQDAYEIGKEKIAVGRLTSGRVSKHQVVQMVQSGSSTTVEKIVTFDSEKESACIGESIGLIFKNDELLQFGRGTVIAEPRNNFSLVKELKLRMMWLSDEPCEIGKLLTLKCASQETEAQISDIFDVFCSSTLEYKAEKSNELEGTDVALVTLKLKDPIVINDFRDVPELGRITLEYKDKIVAYGVFGKEK